MASPTNAAPVDNRLVTSTTKAAHGRLCLANRGPVSWHRKNRKKVADAHAKPNVMLSLNIPLGMSRPLDDQARLLPGDSSSSWNIVGLRRVANAISRSRGSAVGRHLGEGLVQDLQAERNLLFGAGQRGCDTERAAHGGQLYDVHVQAEREAAPRNGGAQLVGAALGRPVGD